MAIALYQREPSSFWKSVSTTLPVLPALIAEILPKYALAGAYRMPNKSNFIEQSAQSVPPGSTR